MNAAETALQGKHTGATGSLYMALELSDKQWQLALGNGTRAVSRFTVEAGAPQALQECIAKAKRRCGMGEKVVVHSCYEAGRDGFWLHRWLVAQGIDNVVVDSASIEVNRRARRAKTDRLDAQKLLSMLLRYHAGERRVWAVVRVPTVEEEDARRVARELGRLEREHTAHRNRIGSLLVLHNVRAQVPVGGRGWPRWWHGHAAQLPPCLRGEIEREVARLVLVKAQLQELEAAQRQAVTRGEQAQVAQLAAVGGVGLGSAWLLSKEMFGWRRFRNRREVGGCLGFVPTPYASGESRLEQGIAQTGNKRGRRLMVELAWSHLRYQPQSALSQWFKQRFADGGKRLRRVGIVALARRLAIALWRYLEHGVLPAGVRLKPGACSTM
ncbi:MAG TPA: IS110 family transposase [Casimicrobiaceae bacterium]